MKRSFVIVLFVAISLVLAGPLLAQGNSQIGTWKLNLAKSNYTNLPTPKSEMRTVEAHGEGAKITYEGVAADGSRIAWTYTTNFDGKYSPISGVGCPNGADTIATTRVDATTTKATAKKAGKVVLTTTSVVSSDGNVLTNTSKGTNAQGQPTSITSVWDKQ